MSKNTINSTINGGAVSIGNLVQGDHNTVHAGNVSASVADRFRDFQAKLPELARPFERPRAEVERLSRQIDALGEQATAPEPDVEQGSSVLKTIRENFSWAWPAVKDLVKIAWPAVLAALA